MQKQGLMAGGYLPWEAACPMGEDLPRASLLKQEVLAGASAVADGRFVAPNQTTQRVATPDAEQPFATRQTPNLFGLHPPKKDGRIFVTQAAPSPKKEGLLAGVQVAVKDNIAVKGLPLTCGSAMLLHFVSPYDATVWHRLAEAGAVLVGKTNMDAFGMGVDGSGSVFGAVANPVNSAFTAGGSSGGSAAAVAAGLCSLALGSDTGGSVRQPAAFCGIWGLKPTFGALSRYGLVAHGSHLEQIGLLAKDAQTLANGLFAASGADEQDATARPNPFASVAVFNGLPRLVAPKAPVFGVCMAQINACDSDIKAGLRGLMDGLKRAGATVKEVALPDSLEQLTLYQKLSYPAVYANMARYQGVRYGGNGQVENCGYPMRQKLLEPEVLRRMALGKQFLEDGMNLPQAYDALGRLRAVYNNALTGCDALLLPATATTAFPLQGDAVTRRAAKESDRFLVGANLAGLPALTLPVGLAKTQCVGKDHPLYATKMPYGAQLVGRPFEDFALLGLGQWVTAQMGASASF